MRHTIISPEINTSKQTPSGNKLDCRKAERSLLEACLGALRLFELETAKCFYLYFYNSSPSATLAEASMNFAKNSKEGLIYDPRAAVHITQRTFVEGSNIMPSPSLCNLDVLLLLQLTLRGECAFALYDEKGQVISDTDEENELYLSLCAESSIESFFPRKYDVYAPLNLVETHDNFSPEYWNGPRELEVEQWAS